MKKALEIRQQIAALAKKQRALADKAQEEKRDLSEDESNQFDDLQRQITELEPQLTRAEALERNAQMLAGEKAADDISKQERKDLAKYRFGKVLRAAVSNKPLDGLEREMAEEAHKEATAIGRSIEGVGVPSMFMRLATREEMKRDMTVGSATAGGNTVATDLNEIIPVLRPQLQVVAAGARTISQLVGNVDFPKGTAGTSATWDGENDAAAETNATIGKVSMTPKRLAAFTDVSLQLINQSSIAAENFIREDLQFAIAKALDSAAINGSGTAPVPPGILNLSAGNTVALGANGAALTWAKIVEFMTSVDTANALAGDFSWIGTPGVRGQLMTTEKASGTAQFIMSDPNNLLGFPFLGSTQVPSNLTKGSGTDLHALIFGNFSNLLIGQWGMLDIVATNNRIKEGLKEIVVNSYWDIAARHEEGFAFAKDVLVA